MAERTITIATMIWHPTRESYPFSRIYDESWVLKLFAGVARNLTAFAPRFVCYVDEPRDLPDWVAQRPIANRPAGYRDFTQPYELGGPMMLMGLDTVIVGDIDPLAAYCFDAQRLALPAAIYRRNTVCNAVALVPAGHEWVYAQWDGSNDMAWLRLQHKRGKVDVLDRLFPGQIVSYKEKVKRFGLDRARIVFFHGEEKPHELGDLAWIREHWRT